MRRMQPIDKGPKFPTHGHLLSGLHVKQQDPVGSEENFAPQIKKILGHDLFLRIIVISYLGRPCPFPQKRQFALSL